MTLQATKKRQFSQIVLTSGIRLRRIFRRDAVFGERIPSLWCPANGHRSLMNHVPASPATDRMTTVRLCDSRYCVTWTPTTDVCRMLHNKFTYATKRPSVPNASEQNDQCSRTQMISSYSPTFQHSSSSSSLLRVQLSEEPTPSGILAYRQRVIFVLV